MEVDFDDAKNESNLAKHGVSLQRAEDFDLSNALIDVDDSQDYGEVRYLAIGWVASDLHTLAFTVRDETIRAISLRRATRQEARLYADEC